MKRIIVFVLCIGMLMGTVTPVFADASPEAETITPSKKKKKKKEKKDKKNKKQNDGILGGSRSSDDEDLYLDGGMDDEEDETESAEVKAGELNCTQFKDWFPGMYYDLGERLVSPETGMVDDVSPESGLIVKRHHGYVDDTATPVIDGLYNTETKAVNWEKLEEINPEIYAWVYMPQNNINYPVLQRNGKAMYKNRYSEQLHYKWHDYFDEEKEAGSIFSLYPTCIKCNDQISFLYGNNVLDGSMFENLHMFSQDVDVEDLHLSEENEKTLLSRIIDADGIRQLTEDDLYVYVTVKDWVMKYRIYSAHYANDDHLQFYLDDGLLQLKLQTQEEVNAYIDMTLNPMTMSSVMYDAEDVTHESSILTMSTSIKDDDNGRLLVHGVLVDRVPAVPYQ